MQQAMLVTQAATRHSRPALNCSQRLVVALEALVRRLQPRDQEVVEQVQRRREVLEVLAHQQAVHPAHHSLHAQAQAQVV